MRATKYNTSLQSILTNLDTIAIREDTDSGNPYEYLYRILFNVFNRVRRTFGKQEVLRGSVRTPSIETGTARETQIATGNNAPKNS
jgi:hypothetical protein